MTLASLNATVPWPGFCHSPAAVPAINTLATIDAAGEYACFIINAREAMAISHVGFRIGGATGSPTADVRIETVDASGLPSGTLWATTTNIVTGTMATGWVLAALTSTANIVAGDKFAVKILYNSGTSWLQQHSLSLNFASALPYMVINAGTPTKTILNASPALALGSSATAFYGLNGFTPVSTIAANTFNNTSAARRGLRFQVPFKCRCVGLRTWTSPSTTAGDLNVALFSDAGAELSSSSTAYDGDLNTALGAGPQSYYFDNPVTLEPATWYRAALEPSSATNITIVTFALPSSNYRSGTMFGSNAHYTTYVTDAWTDTATDTIPLLDILIDQFDKGDGAGGGGSTRVYGGG